MKFRHKIVVAMLCLLAAVYGISGCLLISLSFSDSLNRAKDSAYRSYHLVVNVLQAVSALDEGIDDGNISNVLAQVSVQNPSWTSLQLSSPAGTIFTYGTTIGNYDREAYPANSVQLSVSHEQNAHQLILIGNFQVQDENLYLDIVYDVSDIYALRDHQETVYCGLFIIMLAVCGVLVYSIAWKLTKPLSKLSKATKELASGNLKYRFRYTSEDEVGQVATDFNKMARQLEKSVDLLQENLERQKRFMGSFAHELKTPMTSVIGYADLLRNGMLDQEEGREAANYIFTESKRLERLSIKLLDLLVIEQKNFSMQEVDVRRLIEQVTETQEEVLRKANIAIQLNCESGICLMEPDLISSLLLNLIDNARKAIEHDGEIDVSCQMTPEGCVLCVSDDGRGIPASAIPHLEEAFYRVDKARSREQGGAGLGLALCHEIIKLHNGCLRFESKEGAGTKVIAELKGGQR